MKITRVHIENYRSIEEIDLHPGDHQVLIGANNTGKSNILAAINLVLGEAWPTDRTFTLEDFHHHDSERDIVIQVYFDSPLETWRNMNLTVSGFELRCHAYKRAHRGLPRGTLTHDFTCLNAKGEIIKYPAEPLQEGKQARFWFDLKVSGELRQQVPFIYFDPRRQFYPRQLRDRWSVLGKMLDVISTEIHYDKTTVKVTTSQGEVKMTRRQAFEHKLGEAYAYLRNPDLADLERILNTGLEQMGWGPQRDGASIRMTLHDPVDPLRELRLLVDGTGTTVAAERTGAGLQGAIIIAILMAYGEIRKEGAILVIDGPELFLHLQKIRAFREGLRALRAGHQVLLATHSPEFIDISRPDQIWLTRCESSTGTTVVGLEPGSLDAVQEQGLGRQGLPAAVGNEVFFSDGVVLVADYITKTVLNLVAAAMGIHLEQAAIAVVDCGDKSNILVYAKISAGFKIPAVVVAEGGLEMADSEGVPGQIEGEDTAPRLPANVNQALQAAVQPDDLFWLSPDLATTIGISIDSDHRIREAADRIGSCPVEALPTVLVAAIQRIVVATGKMG